MRRYSEPKFFRRWDKFDKVGGEIEYHSRKSFFLALWCGSFELQFNRWRGM